MTRPRSILAAALPSLLAASAAAPPPVRACHTYDHVVMLEHMGMNVSPQIKEMLLHHPLDRTVVEYEPLAFTPCADGFAGPYPCSKVDLLAALPASAMGAAGMSGNDIWGWTDPVTGHEWALMGLSNGTSFVDVTDPVNPVYMGRLPSHNLANSTWRDIKVYADHAFIVSEASGHGMQVFDLSKLRSIRNPPVTFDWMNDLAAHYDDFGNAHNVAINEQTGFAYAVGTSTCSAGLHMVNIQNPSNPTSAGCYSSDGYTHDVQCVVYHGPDLQHQGDEICFASNEDTVTIVDVSNKMSPQQLSRTGYLNHGYTHQGWLTEDHRYFVHDDELDEAFFGHNTWTYVWDLTDLETPLLVDHFESSTPAIDHNQYVRDGFTFQSNYRAGLRILRIVDPAQGLLEEDAFFDTLPANDGTDFSGTWSNYPYFESGIVIVSDINSGLFVLRPNLAGSIFADGFESGDLSAWSEIVP
jgi:choice-of-anchor B domain-containing protein